MSSPSQNFVSSGPDRFKMILKTILHITPDNTQSVKVPFKMTLRMAWGAGISNLVIWADSYRWSLKLGNDKWAAEDGNI